MATVYLAPAPTGDDTRTYAQAQNPATPWATPGKVQTSAVTGDTVQMATGTYTFVTINFTKSFTFQAASGATVILDGGGVSAVWNTATATNITLTVNGLRFTNAAQTDVGGYAMLALGGTGNTLNILNCQFYANQVISNAFSAGCVWIYNATNGTLNVTNCAFYNNSGNGSSVNTSIFHSSNSTGCVFNLTGCTIAFPSGLTFPIIQVFSTTVGSAATLTVKNTIVYNASGVTVTSNHWGGTFSYSDFYLITSNPTGTGVITSDPLFVDAPNANFKLRPTSPCIGTGTL